MPRSKPTLDVIARLTETIAARRSADPAGSYTATLLAGGVPAAARKFGEEALEAVIAALERDADALTMESADVLYHLFVLWAAAGVEPGRVWAELERREGRSGVAEKAARGRRSDNK
jgi:phosphoribosyl-ATP pyrophosphohydrolase